MAEIISEVVVFLCFIALIYVLFDEGKDYVFYSFLIVIIAGLVSASYIEDARELEEYILAIHWDVIFFLISMFAIVEILKGALVFQYVASVIVNRYKTRIRKMFWMICLTSTLSAAVIEDLSVAIIFIPIIIETCKEIKVNPKAFLLGMTICINLASTLTPFGSAENVMIAAAFNFTLVDFIKYIALFFVIATLITLALLDKFILQRYIMDEWKQYCEDKDDDDKEEVVLLSDFEFDQKVLRKNFIALAFFFLFLILIPQLFLAGLIGLLIFTAINPKKDKKGKERPNVSDTFNQVDFKLIFFFIALFILVHLMELNGFIDVIHELLVKIPQDNIFLICFIVLIMSSLLSGLIDNAPVTILFIPIILKLLDEEYLDPNVRIPLVIALILGVNLGGNFLPQGSAADMMTLELSDKYCVYDVNYKVLAKIGGLFALLHIILGTFYLAFIIYVVI